SVDNPAWRRRLEPFDYRRAVGPGPAVVRTGDPVVDLFPGVLPNVVDEEPARTRLESRSERIAQAERPDYVANGIVTAVERVICGCAAVGVEAQDLTEARRQPLGALVLRRERVVVVIADAEVEASVRTEVQRAAIVIGGCAEIFEIEDD